MKASLKAYLTTFRIWQWAKNLVVFTLPLGSGFFDVSTLYNVLFSFIGNQFSDLIEVKEFQLSNFLSFELILIFLLLIIFLLLRIFFKFK